MPCQIALSRLCYEKSLQQGLDNVGTFQVHTNLCNFEKANSLMAMKPFPRNVDSGLCHDRTGAIGRGMGQCSCLLSPSSV